MTEKYKNSTKKILHYTISKKINVRLDYCCKCCLNAKTEKNYSKLTLLLQRTHLRLTHIKN